MELNEMSIQVFQIDNDTFENVGELNQYTSVLWPSKYNGYAECELWAPITDDNVELLQQGHVLWKGGDSAFVIEIIEPSTSDDGTKTYHVKGRTLEKYLTQRIVWGTYTATNKHPSTIMYAIVRENCISPNDANRVIPYLVNGTDGMSGTKTTYQKTGGEVYDALVSIGNDSGLGFRVRFDPANTRMVFEVVVGKDRTVNQTENEQVKLSTELSDIMSSSYYNSNQQLKNVALVAGEESGTSRKRQIAGDNTTKGITRRELYVDARDLQSESTDESGQQVTLSDEEYNKALIQRGAEKLAECQVVETFEAKIRVNQDGVYKFGVDYFEGDKITVEDNELHVVVDAVVSASEESYSEESTLQLTFGYERPTLIEKVKQKIALGSQ